MNDILLSPVPLEQLKTVLSEIVETQLAKHLSPTSATDTQSEFITRKEAAKILGISLTTLNEWTKSGHVTGYRIASSVRYKREEIQNSLTQIQSLKYVRR